MLPMDFLQSTKHFQAVGLQTGDVLFASGDKDQNIYIILEGSISVEKKLANGSIKHFATLESGNIFGEAALNNNDPKQVDLVALSDTKLLSINAQQGMTDFISEYPKEGLELLKNIINLGNKRVQEANNQIASQYEMTQEILALKTIDYTSIFSLLDHFTKMLELDRLYYFEKNPVLDNYYNCKYNSNNQGILSDEIIEITSGQELITYQNNSWYNRSLLLQIWDLELWTIVIHRQKDFSANEDKIISSITASLSGVFRQKKLLDEQRDREYMKE